MNAMKKSLLGAAITAAFGFATTAQAGVVIDLFTDPVGGEQFVKTSTLNATVSDQNVVAFPTANVIGGYRDLSIKKTNDDQGLANFGESKLSASGGVLAVDNAFGNYSKAVVTWDGSNNAGALGMSALPTGFGGTGVDLTVGGTANQIFADILGADLGFDYKITVWDMDGSKSILSAGVQFSVLSPVSSNYLFDWFNLASGSYCNGVAAPPACTNPATELDFSILRSGGFIDFEHIGALQLELSNVSTASVDLGIGNITTVPEPGALALVGVALLGVGVAGRRNRALKA